MVNKMRVIVNRLDRVVAAVLAPPEQRRLYDRLQLRNAGDLLFYDDGVEYCCPYTVELRKATDYYVAEIEGTGSDGTIYRYLLLRFKNLGDLTIAVPLLERHCNDAVQLAERERELLKRYALLTAKSCAVQLDFNVYDLVKRLWLIGRRLRLF